MRFIRLCRFIQVTAAPVARTVAMLFSPRRCYNGDRMSVLRKIFRPTPPEVIDYEMDTPAHGGDDRDGRDSDVLRYIGPGAGPEPGAYKLQQSYDALLTTVQELRATLDGQVQRQEQLLAQLATLPHAVEALPQTSQLQAQMLETISQRLAIHVQQQKHIAESISNLIASGKPPVDLLKGIREQMETSTEIDRQLVEAFNRFSMMLDRLQLTNRNAVECLSQVRDSYAHATVQVQDWIDKSRTRNTWMINSAFVMALVSLLALLILLVYHK